MNRTQSSYLFALLKPRHQVSSLYLVAHLWGSCSLPLPSHLKCSGNISAVFLYLINVRRSFGVCVHVCDCMCVCLVVSIFLFFCVLFCCCLTANKDVETSIKPYSKVSSTGQILFDRFEVYKEGGWTTGLYPNWIVSIWFHDPRTEFIWATRN